MYSSFPLIIHCCKDIATRKKQGTLDLFRYFYFRYSIFFLFRSIAIIILNAHLFTDMIQAKRERERESVFKFLWLVSNYSDLHWNQKERRGKRERTKWENWEERRIFEFVRKFFHPQGVLKKEKKELLKFLFKFKSAIENVNKFRFFLKQFVNVLIKY